MRKLIVIAVSVTVAVSAGIFAYLNSESRIDNSLRPMWKH